MVRSQITTMKIRNRNGRTHAAFSALDTTFGAFNSATLLSRLAGSCFREEINLLDKYCPAGSDGKLPHRRVVPALSQGRRLNGMMRGSPQLRRLDLAETG